MNPNKLNPQQKFLLVAAIFGVVLFFFVVIEASHSAERDKNAKQTTRYSTDEKMLFIEFSAEPTAIVKFHDKSIALICTYNTNEGSIGIYSPTGVVTYAISDFVTNDIVRIDNVNARLEYAYLAHKFLADLTTNTPILDYVIEPASTNK